MIYQGRARYPVREAVLHCSATKPQWMDTAAFAAQVAEIRRWHVEDNGWRDIGYHWLISRRGSVLPGRPEDEIGAHVMGHNRGTLGICLIGGAGSSADDPFEAHFTEAQDRAVRSLLRAIGERTVLNKITGHNAYAAKACPGFRAEARYGGLVPA